MKVLFFCGESDMAKIVAASLENQFELVGVVVESPQSRVELIKRRINRLGVFKVVGQLTFQLLLMPLLRLESKQRKKELLASVSSLEIEKIKKVERVNSINSNRAILFVKKQSPDFIFVFGTRIISKKVLNELNSVIINLHVGITPEYRGVHGGYWSIVNKDVENFGVSLHKVDKGIDTGEILWQKTCGISDTDNFNTYPILQLILGLEGIAEIEELLDKNSSLIGNTESKLYHHPTAYSYLVNRFFGKVK